MSHATSITNASNENMIHSTLNMLKGRNFRLLWLSETISLLGDQFTLIALPWLVLQLTGDAVAMGTVLAMAGVPRALFMLIGGALTDRFSPQLVMLLSNIFRLIFVTAFATVILLGSVQMWMIYIFALAFGTADAFFFPAQRAIVPQLVPKEHLQTGNAIIQGTSRLSMFAGPILAGALIALLAGSGSQIAVAGEIVPDIRGIGIAFGFDAFTFLFSAIMLWMMTLDKPKQDSAESSQKESVLTSIWEGLINVWNDTPLRVFFGIVVAVHLFATGPIIVGIPVLAGMRFVEGAAAFGIIMSAFGGGNFLGILLAGVLPKPAPQRLGIVMLLVVSIIGIGLAALGFAPSTAIAALIALAIGIAEGYLLIMFTTWLQDRTPQRMLGRMMSLLTFASVGLIPISTALSGALIGLNATALFVGAGAFLVLTIAIAAHNPEARTMGMGLPEERQTTAKKSLLGQFH